MPNNPGRIDGDYSTGEKEDVKYVDPPSGFGSVKKTAKINMLYVITLLVILLLMAYVLLR